MNLALAFTGMWWEKSGLQQSRGQPRKDLTIGEGSGTWPICTRAALRWDCIVARTTYQ